MDGPPREVLERMDELLAIGLKPPQVTVLAKRLEQQGLRFDRLPLTLDEMVESLRKNFEQRGVKTKIKNVRSSVQERAEKAKSCIEVERLVHRYPDGTVALRGVNLEIAEGEFVGLIGQNGSGKTTLVKHFNALLKPTEGNVKVFNVDTSAMSPDRMGHIVGYCFQNPDNQIFCNVVRDEISYVPINLDLPSKEIERRVEEAAAQMELTNVLDEDPYALSLGQRLRIAVASVLAMKPKVLIVDEPTTGQDYKRGKEIMDLITKLNAEGTTAIVITHDMNLCAEYVKRVVAMKDGQILLDGSTREVFSKADILSETFLTPPQVTLLGQRLGEHLPDDILTVDEAHESISKLLES